MKKTMKRTLSLVLAVCLIAGLLIVPAAAASTAPVFADEGGNTFIMNGGETSVASVTFTLAAAPASDTTFALYNAETDGTALKRGVTTTDTTLTFDSLDPAIEAGDYYVSATESGNDESARTAVTVQAATTEPDPTPETYQVSTDNNILHGHVTVKVNGEEASTAAAGATVTVAAAADSGYELDKITVTNVDDGTITVPVNDDGTFTMPAYSVMVSATFKDAAYAITVTAGEHGSASASTTEATKGAAVTLTIEPDDGYEVNEVTVNGEALNAQEDGAYTFNMPGQAVTVNVTFRAT